MNLARVTKSGLEGTRPGREALPGARRPPRGEGQAGAGSGPGAGGDQALGGRRRRRPGPEAGRPRSYYGLPVLNKPVWEAREIAGYFFLGGLAGASSLVALGAEITGRPQLARGAKAGAAAAASLSLVALVKDLGRPARFLNMMRVFKPTSPMSVGTWILSGYAPAALAAAASDLTGRAAPLGLAATAGAALLGPAVASYTGVLVSNTAVPAWHDARRMMPFLFVSSAAAAAAGLGLACAAEDEAGPMYRLAVLGAAAEVTAEKLLERQLDPVVGRAYHEGRAGKLLRASQALSAAGAAGAVGGALLTGGRAGRALRVGAGAALLAASACTRFGVFHAGLASAQDPAATIEPQRARLRDPAAAG